MVCGSYHKHSQNGQNVALAAHSDLALLQIATHVAFSHTVRLECVGQSMDLRNVEWCL